MTMSRPILKSQRRAFPVTVQARIQFVVIQKLLKCFHGAWPTSPPLPR